MVHNRESKRIGTPGLMSRLVENVALRKMHEGAEENESTAAAEWGLEITTPTMWLAKKKGRG